MRLTLTVAWNQKRNQYEAYCHECHSTVATWTAEWLALHQKEPPIGWDHDCPTLNRQPTQHPAEYFTPGAIYPTTQENKTS